MAYLQCSTAVMTQRKCAKICKKKTNKKRLTDMNR